MVEVVKIKKIRSTIGVCDKTLKIMMSLGFSKRCSIGKFVFHTLTPQIQGMVSKVSHLVSIVR